MSFLRIEKGNDRQYNVFFIFRFYIYGLFSYFLIKFVYGLDLGSIHFLLNFLQSIRGRKIQRRVKKQGQRVSWQKGNDEVVWSGFNQHVSKYSESRMQGNIEKTKDIISLPTRCTCNNKTWLFYFASCMLKWNCLAGTLLL